MGCGIHAVLQKRNSDGKWKTVDTDVLQFMSSTARWFNSETADHRTSGIPLDFDHVVDQDGAMYHDQFFMGEHSFGYLTLEDFCNLSFPETDRVSFEKTDWGYTIEVETHPEDFSALISAMQMSYRHMYYNLKDYRLVIGYDS